MDRGSYRGRGLRSVSHDPPRQRPRSLGASQRSGVRSPGLSEARWHAADELHPKPLDVDEQEEEEEAEADDDDEGEGEESEFDEEPAGPQKLRDRSLSVAKRRCVISSGARRRGRTSRSVQR